MTRTFRFLLLCLTAAASIAAPAHAARDVPVRSLTAYPPSITLETSRDFHTFVAVATYEDDVTEDVTAQAAISVRDPEIAKLDGRRLLPAGDGSTLLRVEWSGHKVEIPVAVKGADSGRPVSFMLDVMPVFMRENCNSGSCHGAARGQDGFRLSLFGFDPEGDHFRLTRELSGRRVNLALPEDSLLLTKPVNSVPHTGGRLFEAGSPAYQTIAEWIASGVPYDGAEAATVTAVHLEPPSAVLEGSGATMQFTVRATYSDGHDRDVTPLAVFLSSNDPSAAVSRDGLVTAGARGEAFIMARFEKFTVGSPVIVIPDNLQYTKPSLAEHNYIDELVHRKLHRLRIIPSDVCDDATFLRRVSIDITGRLPEPEAARAFIADPSPDKRARLIDELLETREFTEMWVMKWAELLQIRTNPVNQVSYKSTLLYYNWLRDRIAANVPFNQIVRELLASTGGTFTNPATNYYQIERDTLKVAENAAQVFLGMRLQCAQCHNHPFDRWTMDDYYGFAAFFAQIGRKQAEDPRETVVFDNEGGEVNHLVTKSPVKPKFLGGPVADVRNGGRRQALVEWLGSPDNAWFANNLANIIWSHFFGIGIVEPVDDVRVSNPPSNGELLEALGRTLVTYNYDFKQLVRDICNSRTYQASSQVNESNANDTRNFSHSLVRRQRAEVLLDTISQVTETRNKFRGLPEGARAVQIADGNVTNYFLRTFGRAERTTVCSCEVRMDPNLGQALHLLNGDVTQNRITGGGVVKRLLDAGKSPSEVIDELYMRCFTREPLPSERERILAAVDAAPEETRAILEDVFWAILNSKEFMFNH